MQLIAYFDSPEIDGETEERNLYSVQWTWRNEFAVLVVLAWDVDTARHIAEKSLGRGGAMRIEELTFEDTHVATIMDSRE